MCHTSRTAGHKTAFTVVNLSGNQAKLCFAFIQKFGPLLVGSAGNSMSQVPVSIPPNRIQVLERSDDQVC
jgi:hypothetical protein